MSTSVAVIVVLIMGLNGQVEHTSALKSSCPDMKVLGDKLENMKVVGKIKNYGAVCIPASFPE